MCVKGVRIETFMKVKLQKKNTKRNIELYYNMAILGSTVADGWAGAVVHKLHGIQKCD